ncbi:hypothetical protein ACQR1W_12855 [Bradyrhizobium sp. HKCCYLS1011]|uniref:hypothetical protein n=1 Tax=Bradyrhizobium sp. HKCCYLS1011 TaxID=3420733 RepID=UPI003EB7D374
MCAATPEGLDLYRFSGIARSAISQHISRDFGDTGFHKVTIAVSNAEQFAFSYTIGRLWKRRGSGCRSALWIISPKVMAGTVVVIEEQAGIETTNIWLRLRTSTKAIFVTADRLYDCVLGTDFTYADFRFWAAFDMFLLEKAEESALDGHPVTLVSGSVCTICCEERPVKMTFCAESGILRELIWPHQRDHNPIRVLQAGGLLKIDGIWTPQVIAVSRPRDGYSSRMTLRGTAHHLEIDDKLFDPERVNSALLAEFTDALKLVPNISN